MSPGPRLTSIPSGILIHPSNHLATIHQRYTDRHTDKNNASPPEDDTDNYQDECDDDEIISRKNSLITVGNTTSLVNTRTTRIMSQY